MTYYFCDECCQHWDGKDLGETIHCPDCGGYLTNKQTADRKYGDDDAKLNIIDLLKKYDIEYRNGKYFWQGRQYDSYQEPLDIAKQKADAMAMASTKDGVSAEEKSLNEKIVVALKTPEEMTRETGDNPVSGEEILVYDDVHDLRKDILAGKIKKNHAVQVKPDNENSETAWKRIDEVAEDLGLGSLYQSKYDFVTGYSKKGKNFGFAAVFILEAIWTALRMYNVNPNLALFWVFYIGGLSLVDLLPTLVFDHHSRFPVGWLRLGMFASWFVLPGMLHLQSKVLIIFFGMLIGMLVVSSLYGLPVGYLIGTIVGHLKERKKIYAPDVVREPNGIFWKKSSYPFACYWLLSLLTTL